MMKRGSIGVTLLASAMALTLSCTEKGRSLVLVELTKDATTVDHVTVVVSQGSGHLAQPVIDWPAGITTLKLGVYLAKDVSGDVDVVACGLAGGAFVASAGPKTATVKPGEATPIDMSTKLMLVGGAPLALCGNLGSDGGAGDGGAAGTSGGGGTGGGGGTVDAGGDRATGAAGTMGAAGAGGTMGAAGTGGAGGAGGAPHVVGWSAPQDVAVDLAIDESWPAVAVDSKGNAVVAFQHASALWANYYTASTNSWGTPGKIDDRATTSYRPRIAVDKTGAYLVVWQQDPNLANKGIWWSSSTDGKTWSVPESIIKSTAGGPELSMNADGAAVVAWPDQDPMMNYNYKIMASVRPPGAAWTTPKVLRTAVDGGGSDPAVGMTGKGEAFVTWVQSDGGTAGKYSIWWSQFKQGAFSDAALFETYDGSHAWAPAIAVNAAGAAIVTYVLVDAGLTTTSLWARRYSLGMGFGTPSMVAQGTEIDIYWPPAVTLDEAGVATSAWAYKIQGKYQVYAGRGDASNKFGAAMAMEMDNAAADDGSGSDPTDHSVRATWPILGVDPAGNVTLLWRKRVGTRFDLWTRSFPKNGPNWTDPKKLETSDAHGIEWHSLGVGADGTAIAAWDYDTEWDVLAAVFR